MLVLRVTGTSEALWACQVRLSAVCPSPACYAEMLAVQAIVMIHS